MNNKIKRYFIYARKSSENEDRQMQSIEDQINKLKNLSINSDIEIIKIFKESKSAKKPDNRPEFNKMLDEIENGKADGILCWQVNRLTRNPVDSGRISWMLQNNIIKSIQTIEKEYLPSDNVILFNVESGMANQFIIDLRKNTIRGIESKIDKGWFPALAPQGYLNDIVNKTIVKDPERFKLVEKIWKLMLTKKYSIRKLLNIVNNDWGYTTRKTKRGGNKPMSQSELYKLLKNPFYYGYFKYDNKLYKGKHKPMITIDDFNRVQEIFKKTTKPRIRKNSFSFTGIITCSNCGCLITAETKRKHIKSENKHKDYTYYRCTRKKREINCKEPSITLDELEKQIAKEIEKYTIPEEFKNWALNVIKDLNSKEVNDREKIYKMLNKKYLALQKQLDNLTKMRLKELIDDEEFIKEKNSLKKEIKQARQKLNQNQDNSENWIDKIEKAFNFAVNAKKVFTNTKDINIKREVLNTIGQTYTLHNKKLKITPQEWLIPISNLTKKDKKLMRGLELRDFTQYKSKNKALNLAFTRWGE